MKFQLNVVGKEEFGKYWDSSCDYLYPIVISLLEAHQSNLDFIAQWSATVRAISEESNEWRRQLEKHTSKLQKCMEVSFEAKQFAIMANLAKVLHLSMRVSGDCRDGRSIAHSLIKICNERCEEVPEEILELMHFLLNSAARTWSPDEFSQVFNERLVNSLKRCIRNVFGNCSKQLISCTCLAIIQDRSLLPNIKTSVGVLIIPCLLSIVEGDKSYGEIVLSQRAKASIALAFVVALSEDYQRIAEENRAIPKIQQMLLETKDPNNNLALLCIENALIALATISGYREDVRTSIFSYLKLVRMIVDFLDYPSDPVKTAACVCIRSLSRSPKGLRTCLSEFNLVDALTKVLQAIFSL